MLLLTGCAASTIESRQTKYAAAFAALQAEEKVLVQHGEIQRGMSQDAVRIAWGEPSQILTEENQNGRSITWLYTGTVMQEQEYWSRRRTNLGGGNRPAVETFVDHYYNPRDYVSAEVIFVNGKVNRWRTLPRPTN